MECSRSWFLLGPSERGKKRLRHANWLSLGRPNQFGDKQPNCNPDTGTYIVRTVHTFSLDADDGIPGTSVLLDPRGVWSTTSTLWTLYVSTGNGWVAATMQNNTESNQFGERTGGGDSCRMTTAQCSAADTRSLFFLWSPRYDVRHQHIVSRVMLPVMQTMQTKPKETSLEIPRGKSHVARRKKHSGPCFSTLLCEQLPWLIGERFRDHAENSNFGFTNKQPGWIFRRAERETLGRNPVRWRHSNFSIFRATKDRPRTNRLKNASSWRVVIVRRTV